MHSKFAQSNQSGRLLAIYLACGLSFLAAPANAAELALQLDTGMRMDSNPFRFTDTADVQTAVGTSKKSDSITSMDARGALIVPLDSPETRLVLAGQIGHQDYKQFSQLDNINGTYRAALQWRLGNLWRGELLHSGESQLYRYLDGGLTQKVITNAGTTTAEVALRMTPDIEFPMSISRQTVRYENNALQAYDKNDRVIDAGGRWRTGTQSTVRAGYRSTLAQYQNRTAAQIATLDNEYSDRELYLSSDWQYSVMSRLTGRLGYLQRSYQSLTARNFSVLTVEMQAVYDHSPLTRITAEIWNRPYGSTDPSALYTISTGAQIGVRWFATPSTRLSVAATEELQSYKSSGIGLSANNPQVKRTRLGGGIVYAYTRDFRIYAEGFREQMDRGALGSAIHQNSLRVGLEYTYENLTGVALRNSLGDRRL